ncbi:MAG: enoyl-CoA hydratase/isomerase family protein [Spongiibacteraceae bacterium]|nr:enoyl-CoA hydratase/isomerase family protein [Spongiibacteraceae bacterium]
MTSSTEKTVTYCVDNKVATISLNRPTRYNSFTDEMHADFRAAIKHVKSDQSLRCLIIRANGKGFCSGQDLNSRYELVKQGDVNLGESLNKNYNPLIVSLANLKLPVVCAVNGVAAGAGVGLALACDIVIAAQSANFVFSFSKVGLIPDAGCSWSLVQAVGLARARAWCLLGESISAQEAVEQGLIYKCVDDDALGSELDSLVQTLIKHPAQGLALNKRALLSAASHHLQEQLLLEAQLQTIAGRSDDYKEAVCAFVEKREARFSGA